MGTRPHRQPPLASLAALCLLLVAGSRPATSDTSVFLMYSERARSCLENRGSSVGLTLACNESSRSQQWKWVSRLRLFNLESGRCLSIQRKNGTAPILGMTECDLESAQMRWHCDSLGNQLNSILNLQPEAAATGSDALWRVYNTDEDLCSRPYHEIYTIQGNSHGKPCTIPFIYDSHWFHDCTVIGREDGHFWCATTVDYGKDERWGFCPIASDDCETFWDKDPLTNSCYQFNFQSTLSWSEARTSCQQQNSDLLSITELHEQTYINGLLTGYSATLWIGLNDLDINGGWQWSDGSPLKYLNWERDQPVNSLEENCGVIRTESSGRWQNKDCGIARPYVCKKKPKFNDRVTIDSCANQTTKCEPGWLKFQCNCYRLNRENKSWQESQKSCMRSEGSLVSIHHLAELEFILTQVKQDVEKLWIGLNDIKHQMNFEWSDGSPVQFTYWHPFEPNNTADSQEDCVILWGSEGCWKDGPCNSMLPAICKKPGYFSTEEEMEDSLGCSKNWRLHGSSCYFVGEELVTFDEALKKCTDQGSTLVTILNRFEQSFIISLILGRSGNFWTSLQDANHPGAFQWIGGDAVSFTNWNRNQPGYKGGCVVLATGNSVGLWEVKDCHNFQAKFICRQNLATSFDPGAGSVTVTPTPSVTGSCPSGWVSSPTLRYCYKVFHFNTIYGKKNWVQAHMFCREQGAQLLSISSFEEEKFAEKIVHDIFGESEDHEYHWFWLGLNRRNPGTDRSWTWSDGTGYSYNNFGRDTYDDDNIRRCAVTDIAASLWRSVRCEIQLDWICKIRKGAIVKEPEDTEDSSSNKWVRFKDAEYKFFEHRSTWPQARRICTWFRAELASIHSQQELTFLEQSLQELSRVQDQLWWIGLHTYENDGRFRWSDGSLLNFVSWASGRPRPISRDRKCVYMSPVKGVWGDQRCLNDLQYICKRTNTSVIKPPVLPLPSVQYGGCPKGWIPFVNKCYQINGYTKMGRLNWIEAKAACERAGGLLAMISNYHEQAFITALLPNITFDLWIGLHDMSKDFQWLQKKPLKYINWAPGEPSGQHISSTSSDLENCVVIWHALHPQFTGRWDDRSCTNDKNGYICQRSKDTSLPSVPAKFPPTLTSKLTYMNSTYRVIQKPLTWQEAAWLCETRNETLVTVMDPYHQAYLTQVINSVQFPVWIGLSNEEGGRTYSWLGGEELFYSNWQDGEPHQVAGCARMDVDGTWQTSNCDVKLNGAICLAAGDSLSAKSNFSGSCPTSLEDSSWIPFRNHCYTFHLEKKASRKDAAKFCQKVRGAEMLSILDETENVFVWEHLQTYENDTKGAWLSLTYNTKGGTLVWSNKTPLNYSNWAPETENMSLMSPNACYWIKSNTGIWAIGPCTSIALGIVCKMPRAEESSLAVSSNLQGRTLDIILYVLGALVLLTVVVVVLLLLYRRRAALGSRRRAFESARYSRTSSAPSESVEKNILVSDMEMNEQQE
ncbi:C-type mannose receptor 2 isoform X1 [Hypanus sabinus]|uniref:C-type mannose receptor 2 isoform X1 n=2 Tax=Hypanus sabinus TaxID=79690 RepID=UPI0028C4BECF|nr:C-type mannose receptor 2 isoform X1 [Hypanus sabinus]